MNDDRETDIGRIDFDGEVAVLFGINLPFARGRVRSCRKIDTDPPMIRLDIEEDRRPLDQAKPKRWWWPW